MAYTALTYVPGEVLTAAKLNLSAANDASFRDGTGFLDNSIPLTKVKQLNYSTDEVSTGIKWVDGKTIYRKTVNFGALPASSAKRVDHGISGLDFIVEINITAKSPSGTPKTLQVPYGAASDVYALAHQDRIEIGVGSTDRSEFSICYVTLYYTKV